MKKLLLLLPLLFFIVFPQSVAVAQTSSPSAAPTQAVADSQAAAINYTLPYPGLLPDNPLYFLKVLRDQIVMFFISDPLKKSEFLLLQADKRLESSWYLLKEGPQKNSLALSTLGKSTSYLNEALGQERVAAKAGEDVSALQGNLYDAVYKHMIVASSMKKFSGLVGNTSYVTELTRLQQLEKSVAAISKK